MASIITQLLQTTVIGERPTCAEHQNQLLWDDMPHSTSMHTTAAPGPMTSPRWLQRLNLLSPVRTPMRSSPKWQLDDPPHQPSLLLPLFIVRERWDLIRGLFSSLPNNMDMVHLFPLAAKYRSDPYIPYKHQCFVASVTYLILCLSHLNPNTTHIAHYLLCTPCLQASVLESDRSPTEDWVDTGKAQC